MASQKAATKKFQPAAMPRSRWSGSPGRMISTHPTLGQPGNRNLAVRLNPMADPSRESVAGHGNGSRRRKHPHTRRYFSSPMHLLSCASN